ncbi:MAG: porin, partial [Burkholderiales bacterium]
PQSVGVDNTNRNSFLGIAGGWGAFKMGTNENVYERFMYTADPLDGALGPGGNLMILGTPGAHEAFQVGQGNCTPAVSATTGVVSGGCVGFYRRTDHTIWYESPNWGGFTFEADYTLSAYKTAGTAGAPSINPTVISVGGKFQPEGAPFYIDLAYEQHKDMFGIFAIANAINPASTVGTSATGSTDTGIQVGGGWQLGDLGLHLRFEELKYKIDGGVGTGGVTEYKRNAYWLGVKYNLPSGYVGAEIGRANDGKTNVDTVDDTGATMYGIGYFHNLSKQSQLQFIYGMTQNKDNATYTQAAAPGTGPGQDHSVFHVGIKHTF